jgi:hypothetical protein
VITSRLPYERWENYLGTTIEKGKMGLLAKSLGGAEAAFPLIVGTLCLLIYSFVRTPTNPTAPPWFFGMWYWIDLLTLLSAALAAILLRVWIRQRHKQSSSLAQK